MATEIKFIQKYLQHFLAGHIFSDQLGNRKYLIVSFSKVKIVPFLILDVIYIFFFLEIKAVIQTIQSFSELKRKSMKTYTVCVFFSPEMATCCEANFRQ
jgi:hypothetical protein